MAHVFISYKREDRDFAFLVRNEIEKAGYGVWIDDRLEAGESWIAQIENNLQAAFALVLILTPNSQLSKYVTYEWSFALGRGIRVIALLRTTIEPAKIHQRLADIQQIDFRHHYDWDSLFKALEHADQEYEKQPKQHDDPRIADGVPIDAELQRLLGRLRSPDDGIRLGAVRALGLTQNPAAGQALAEVMLDDVNRNVRVAAALALGNIRDVSSLSSLSMVLLGSSDLTLRIAAATSVESMKAPEAIPILTEAMQDSDEDVRCIAVRALSKIEHPDVMPLLRRAKSDPSSRVKWQAAYELLKHLKSTDVWTWVDLLEETFPVEHSELTISGIAVIALKRLQTDEAKELLTEWQNSGTTANWKETHLPF